MSGVPQGWVVTKLSDIAAKIVDGSHNPPSKASEGLPMLSARNVRDGGIFFDDYRLINEDAFELEHRRSRIKPGDVLLTIVGAIGRTAVVQTTEPFTLQRSVAVIGDFGEIEPRFMARAFENPEYQQWLTDNAKGTAQKGVYLKAIGSSEIAVPPLSEQRRIVAKIDSLTGKSRRARDHLDHIPRLVEKYKQAVLAAAFRGDLTRDWRRDQPRPLSVAARQMSQIRQKYADAGDFHPPYDVPAGWRWHRLPQLGDLDRGKSRHRPRNDKRLFGGPYPFVQTGEVRHADRFLTTFQETYSDFGLAQSKLWPIGTVCITIAANIAETAILGIDACFPDSVVGFLPDADKVDASYVEFFLRTARGELEAFAPATAQKNINLDTLAMVRVPAAPLVEQIEIVSRIERAFVWIDRLASEATSARRLVDRLDQAVLAKAFRGELVPQDPEDEPASILLDRLRAARDAAPKARNRPSKRL